LGDASDQRLAATCIVPMGDRLLLPSNQPFSKLQQRHRRKHVATMHAASDRRRQRHAHVNQPRIRGLVRDLGIQQPLHQVQ
jgi:hypothetical protein